MSGCRRASATDYPQGGREREAREQEVEEAVAMEMMIILDMLRWCFVLPNVQATESHTQTETEQCAVNLRHMPG